MYGQIGLEARTSAVALLSNMIGLKQGPAMRRGGTKFIAPVKDSSKRTALLPFQFKTTQAYMIEVGDQYFRFFRNNSQITLAAQNVTAITKANPAVITYAGSDTYANGDVVYIDGIVGMTEMNGRFIKVANVNAGAKTFEATTLAGANIDSTGYGAYVSGGTVAEIYEIASPYTQANLFDSNNLLQLQYAQSADVLFIVNGNYAPRALSRTGHTSWTLTELNFNDGPYLDVNTTATTLELSGTSGSVTVTASAALFAATDVGRLIRWKDPANNWTWLKITAFTDSTHVTATIMGANASAGTATVSWRLGLYSNTTGWPRTITFHQNRITFGGNEAYPDRYDMSIKGGYSGTDLYFQPSNAAGTVGDADAISDTLGSGQVNNINWMASDTSGLLIGTSKQEWIVTSNTTNPNLTPSNRKADPLSGKGGAYIQPVFADYGAMFVQNARRKLHDVVYALEQDKTKPRDLTVAAEHMTRTQVLGLAYQAEPINVVWGYRGDGLLIGQTYYPDENVFGFHRHPIGGYSDAGKTSGAIVESIGVIPSADGSRDELWMIVNRYINGATARYIEYMTRYYEDDMAQADAFHVDSGLTYEGTATATVSGLWHLEGQTIKAMVDGRSHPDLTVANGKVTLANGRTGEKIHLGFSAPWAVLTLHLEAGAADGTAQGKTKRVTGFYLRLLNTLGLKYGSGPDAQLDEYDFGQGAEYDAMTPLLTGDTDFLTWPEGYEQSAQLYFTHDGVFPACIQAIMPHVVTQDR